MSRAKAAPFLDRRIVVGKIGGKGGGRNVESCFPYPELVEGQASGKRRRVCPDPSTVLRVREFVADARE